MKTTFFAILTMAVSGAFFPLFGAETASNPDQRNTPLTVHLIVDGSQALSGVLNEVSGRVSESLINSILQSGDRLTIWSAGKTAQILYSETLKSANDKENIKKILKNLPTQGDSADFSNALQKAAAQKTNQGMQFTMLVSASHTTLSPALLGSAAQLLRFSRVEEYGKWRILIIAPDINDKVRQAAAAYFSGM